MFGAVEQTSKQLQVAEFVKTFLAPECGARHGCAGPGCVGCMTEFARVTTRKINVKEVNVDKVC